MAAHWDRFRVKILDLLELILLPENVNRRPLATLPNVPEDPGT
jgi:hypothetical protein